MAPMEGRLAGRVALVTGAGGPMGLAVARRLAEEGAALLVTDISGGRLGEAVAQLEEPAGGRVVGHRANVLSGEEVDGVLAAGEGLGPVDVLVNIVGGIRDRQMVRAFVELTEQRWDDTFALNLKGTFHLVRRLGPAMMERGWGKVVNVASVDFAGAPGRSDYGAAKAAVASLTRSLAVELAPHVNVNCIAPGLIQTSVLERTAPDQLEAFRRRSVLKRLGRPDDIAGAVAFLASDDAAYVTGVTLDVSGGMWPSL